MEAHNPAWVPGEAELERLLDARTGLYGDLPPGVGPLLEVAARLIARAFAAFAEGDWETCDALVTEGRHACGDVFTAMVEHIASPEWPYRVDSPFWEDFIAVLATAVLRPEPGGDHVSAMVALSDACGLLLMPRRSDSAPHFRDWFYALAAVTSTVRAQHPLVGASTRQAEEGPAAVR